MTVYNPFTPNQSGGGGGSVGGNPFAPSDAGKPQDQVDFEAEQEKEPPFMAEALDHNGLPYYGAGFQGLARKIFGKVFDPTKVLGKDSTKREAFEIASSKIEQSDKSLYESDISKFISRFTGITSEEQAKAGAALSIAGRDVEVEDGEITSAEKDFGSSFATAVGLTQRGSFAALWDIGLEAFALTEKAVEKYTAFARSLDEIGNTTSLPDLTPAIFAEKFKGTPYENAASFVSELGNLNPAILTYNAIRAAASGMDSEAQIDVVKRNLRASNTVFTFMWDNQKQYEYMRRMQEGENPDLLMRELENPWVELVAGIFLDPTTYLGASLPGKVKGVGKLSKGAKRWKILGILPTPFEKAGEIPTISKMLGLNFGSTRIKNSGDLFTKVWDDGLEAAAKALDENPTDTRALEYMNKVIEKADASIQKFAGEYNFFSYNSAGKADIMKKTVGTTITAMFGMRGQDEVVEALNAYRKLRTGSAKSKVEGFMALKDGWGQLPFSAAGMQTMEFMYKLENKLGDIEKMAKRIDDPVEFVQTLMTKTFDTVDSSFPSVNDMQRAKKIVAENIKKGLTPDKRHVALAEKLKKIPKHVVKSQSIHNSLGASKAYRGLQSFFANVHFGMSPGYAMRNVQSDAAIAAWDMGVDVGAEILAKGTASAWNKTVAEKLVAKSIDKQKEILGGFTAYTANKTLGGGKLGFVPDKELFGLPMAQRSELSSSAITTTHALQKEMLRGIRHTMPTADFVGDAHKELLYSLVLENWGDAKKVKSGFLNAIKKGEFERFRYLEMDQRLEEGLRTIDMFDELDAARKSGANSVEFKAKADEIRNKILKKAEEVRKESAMVSEDSAVAKAAGVMQEWWSQLDEAVEGLNAFNARVEYRGQLQGQYQRVQNKMIDQLSQQVDEDTMEMFRDAQTPVQELLEHGRNSLNRFTGEMFELYKQVKYGKITPQEALSLAKGSIVDPANTKALKDIDIVTTFPELDPNILTKDSFSSYLWRWVKTEMPKAWSDYTNATIKMNDEVMTTIFGEDMVKATATAFQEYAPNDVQRLQDMIDTANEWDDYANFVDEAVAAERGILKSVLSPAPPYIEGSRPTKARQIFENVKGGFLGAFDDFVAQTTNEWGKTVPVTDLGDEALEGLEKWSKELAKRTSVNQARAMAVADETRNFIMHDYNKTYGDQFAQYFTMYHYWSSRTYGKFMQRGLDTPGRVGAFVKYRQAMEKIHSDQPEWYRYNIPVSGLPGMEGSPLFFNLEQTFNPMQGLIGVDFNDPDRRVDAMSSVMDDAGKFGFNVSVPLQWAMAARLAAKGEEMAARKWAGRMIPQTRTLKAMLNVMNVELPDIPVLPGIKYGEFDPIINAFGGMDAYEEKRVGAGMAQMIRDGIVSEEQALEAMYQGEGQYYDMAVRRSIDARAGSTIASWTMGIGYKARTETDMEIQAFYDDWYKLMGMREHISPIDYKNQMAALKDDYEFAEAVLLSRRGTDDKHGAFAYNVLGRIAPGEAYQMMEAAGVDGEYVQRFYNDKGDFSSWKPQDKERFMAAIVDMSALFEIPETATKEAWNRASTRNNEVRMAMQEQFGEDIHDKIQTFFDMMEDDKDAAYLYKDSFPEIQAALTFKSDAVMTDPELFAYYGSWDKLESYWDGKVRNALHEKFGNTSRLWGEYFGIKVEIEAGRMDASELTKFRNENPGMFGEYQTLKAELEKQAEKELLEWGAFLPDEETSVLRGDVDINNMSPAQQNMMEANMPEMMPSVDQVAKILDNPTLTDMVVQSVRDGSQLPTQAQKQLEYQAKINGMTPEELIRFTEVALSR